jgi:uncharacterized damage-inducible protein DinB
MHITTAQWLVDYHYWANARLLRAADGIDVAELVAPRAVPCGSLRGTFVHILSAEWIWRQRWLGASPPAMLDERAFATLADVIARWDAEQQAMRAFLADQDDAALARPVTFTNTRGVVQAPVPLWQLLMHCVNHGTQHRSEAAIILTDLGRSPGDLDMALLLRERATAS